MTDSKALFMICRENDIEKMRQALAGGFDPNQRLHESGMKALHIVAARGHQEMVSLLLQQPDIELNPKTQNTGETPLHLAADYGHQEVVVLLLQQPGIDINAADLQGSTALHTAAYRSQEEIVALLLDHPGIEAGATDIDGDTVLHIAVFSNAGLTLVTPGLLRRLLACPSIDPNVKNRRGNTPIMCLLLRGGNLVECLQAFVECDKVDLDDQDVADGWSLEDLARWDLVVETEFKLRIFFVQWPETWATGCLEGGEAEEGGGEKKVGLIENHPILPQSLSPVAKITSVCLLQVDQGAAETGVEGAAGRALRPRLPPPPPPWSSPWPHGGGLDWAHQGVADLLWPVKRWRVGLLMLSPVGFYFNDKRPTLRCLWHFVHLYTF